MYELSSPSNQEPDLVECMCDLFEGSWFDPGIGCSKGGKHSNSIGFAGFHLLHIIICLLNNRGLGIRKNNECGSLYLPSPKVSFMFAKATIIPQDLILQKTIELK